MHWSVIYITSEKDNAGNFHEFSEEVVGDLTLPRGNMGYPAASDAAADVAEWWGGALTRLSFRDKDETVDVVCIQSGQNLMRYRLIK